MIEKDAGEIRSLLRKESFHIALVCLVACIGAVISKAEPTGVGVWDVFVKGALAVLVVLASAKAPRWAVLAMSVCAAAASGLRSWAIPGWLSLVVSSLTVLLHRRNRVLGAVAGGLAVQALLRLPPIGFFGFPSILAGLPVLVVLASGYQYASPRARRLTRRATAAITLVTFGILIVGGVSLLNARSDVDRGVAAARRGLAAARSGDPGAVAHELEEAERALMAASSRASGLPARFLKLVPIAAQHQSAIASATREGSVIAREAAATVRDADIASVSLSAGEIDLGVLESMAPRLRSTEATLKQALDELRVADSPWLLPFLSARIQELASEVEMLVPEVALGAHAAEVMPVLLGADEPKTYFVLFGTPAESREFGGFIGSWALLTFDSGRLELGDSGRIRELLDVARSSELDPVNLPEWYLDMARPTQFPQNLTGTPDFPTVAEVSRQVLGSVAPDGLAGFVYIDTWAVINLLRVTGPIATSFQNEPLTYDNAQDFFFRAQFETNESRTLLFENLAEVGRVAIEGLLSEATPGPEELGQLLGPAARAGRLQVVTFDDDANEFLRSVRLLRDFRRSGTSDYVGLVQTNALSNKMDLYLQRALEYRVEVVDGTLAATATARLRSVVPDDAPDVTLGTGDTTGFNRVLLSLYTPHALTGVTVNGLPAEHRATREFGLERYLVDVTLPPTGEEFVIEFDLVGLAPQGESYSLEVWHQPLVNTDQVDISYTGPDGEISWQGPLVENLVLRVEHEN